MKKNTFSRQTDVYKSEKQVDTHRVIQALVYSSDGLQECYISINTYDYTDIGPFPVESSLITLSRQKAIKFAEEILKLYQQ
ncbi:hypothetical protein [Spirosoma fluviale]|uniref:Uncharacterized protein n=1 Tax=Spirosoma fluviale TaxID=1597977 RepID=A0A286FES4_9BACT|nr:hypothetical protein [Spirosoma fluviale]SOD81745.1 hypothetical protein SAMN06269250_1898 [Spirosoma fluviale]